MSIATWSKKFIGSMEEAVKSERASIEHGLRKWKGLRKRNLNRHKVYLESTSVKSVDGGFPILICSENCALCKRYYRRFNAITCIECSLFKVNKESPCDGGPESPYNIFAHTRNPEPMINLLQRALDALDEREKTNAGK